MKASVHNEHDIGKCLTSLGIEISKLIPTNITQKSTTATAAEAFNQFRSEINIFPLEWFDSGNDFEFFIPSTEGRFHIVSL